MTRKLLTKVLTAGAAIVLLAALVGLAGPATSTAAKTGAPSISKEPFGTLADGTAVDRYTLTNSSGMTVKILTYGGIIQQVWVPDQRHHLANVTLGFDKLRGSSTNSYVDSGNSPYFGALIGRYGNRIANGQFSLNGTTYHLPINNPPNSLHGGTVGFDKHVWTVTRPCREGQRGARLASEQPRRRPGVSRQPLGRGHLQTHGRQRDRDRLQRDNQSTRSRRS